MNGSPVEFPTWPSGIAGVSLLDAVDDRGHPQTVPAETRPRRHEGPVRASVSVAAMPATRACRALAAAGVQPPAEVTAGLARARELIEEARRATDEPATATVRQLASGDLAPADVQPADREALRRQARDRHALLQQAADVAYATAAAVLASVGDAMLAELRTIVRAALDDPDADGAEDRWTAAWAAVRALRHGRFAPSARGVPAAATIYRHAHLARSWQLDVVSGRHRGAVETVDATDGRYRGRRVRVVQRKPRLLAGVDTTLPHVDTLDVAAAHRDDWGADLLLAHESVAAWSEVLAAHAAILDGADDEPARPTAAFM
jgi:hypothetical protein